MLTIHPSVWIADHVREQAKTMEIIQQERKTLCTH